VLENFFFLIKRNLSREKIPKFLEFFSQDDDYVEALCASLKIAMNMIVVIIIIIMQHSTLN